jgi:hypothetical protein
MTLSSVTDLKFFEPVRHRFGNTRKEMTHVHWQTGIFTGHGLHASAHISTLRYPISGKQQRQKFQLSRPISLHGLRSTDLSRESPRYRSMPSSPTTEVIPHGYPRHRGQIKSRRCQRAEGLAYICRSRPFIDHHSPRALQQRPIRHRFRANSICSGCNHDRFMFIDVPLGNLSPDQGCNQIAYTTGPAGQYPNVHQHLRWKSTRCKHPRFASHRTRRFLHNGSWLPGLCQAAQYLKSSGLLCNPIKVQFQMPQNLFPSIRPLNWPSIRPNNHANWILCAQRLSRQTTTCKILRCRDREDSGLSDQQFLFASIDYCTTVSLPMASRALFQMDQAKPTHQEFLWHFGECRQNSNLDRGVSICSGSHTKEATQYQGESLHYFTNFECLGFRKNTLITATYRNNHSTGNLGFRKPVEFIHLTVGH